MAKPETGQPATVERYAVLLRSRSGNVELLGTIYRTQDDATKAGAYWQAASPCGELAEVVSFNVPVVGAPIPSAKDTLPLLSEQERAL